MHAHTQLFTHTNTHRGAVTHAATFCAEKRLEKQSRKKIIALAKGGKGLDLPTTRQKQQ